MNERNALGLSAIMASQDARRGGVSALSAVSLHRLLLVIPALCALAYPLLLSWLSAGLVLAHGSELAERTDRLGQCHRVADTGAGGHAGQLCIWTDARITACRKTRGVSRPMRCPSGVCHTFSLCGVRKRRRRAACAFGSASRMAHLLDADGDDRPLGLQVVIGSICHIARRTSPTGRCPWRFRSCNPAAVCRASHRESSGRLLERISPH